jgi:hypothetical protein
VAHSVGAGQAQPLAQRAVRVVGEMNALGQLQQLGIHENVSSYFVKRDTAYRLFAFKCMGNTAFWQKVDFLKKRLFAHVKQRFQRKADDICAPRP